MTEILRIRCDVALVLTESPSQSNGGGSCGADAERNTDSESPWALCEGRNLGADDLGEKRRGSLTSQHDGAGDPGSTAPSGFGEACAPNE